MADKPAYQMRQKELLALPEVGWDDDLRNRWWDNLIILPTRKHHDSGWLHIAIIGYDEATNDPMILAYPDDICWPEVPADPRFGSNGMSLRTDASPQNHALRLWSNKYRFRVDSPISSVTIEVTPRG